MLLHEMARMDCAWTAQGCPFHATALLTDGQCVTVTSVEEALCLGQRFYEDLLSQSPVRFGSRNIT